MIRFRGEIVIIIIIALLFAGRALATDYTVTLTYHAYPGGTWSLTGDKGTTTHVQGSGTTQVWSWNIGYGGSPTTTGSQPYQENRQIAGWLTPGGTQGPYNVSVSPAIGGSAIVGHVTFKYVIVNESGTGDNIDHTVYKDVYFGYAAPTLHPQPYEYHIANLDKKPVIGILRDPAGTTKVTAGCGPSQTMDGGWQPPDDALRGVYTWYFGFANPPGSSSLYTYTGGFTDTLVDTPTDLQYSAKWTAAVSNSVIPAGSSAGVPGTAGNGSVTNNTGGNMVLQWKDQQGNLVGTPQTVAPGAAAEPSLQGVNIPPGQTNQMTLVDTAHGNNPIGQTWVSNAGDGTGPTMATPIIAVVGAAPAVETPTAGQTNKGNQQQGVNTPQAGSNTLVNNSNSTTLTNQDMYNDVRQAIIDSDRSSSPSMQGPSDTLDGREAERSRGHLDDIDGQISTAKTNADKLKDSAMGMTDFGSWVANVPTSGFGQVSSLSFGKLSFANGQFVNLGADLTQFGDIFVKIRTALLWMFRLAWVVMCAKAVWETFIS